jgi:hypothetical protein
MSYIFFFLRINLGENQIDTEIIVYNLYKLMQYSRQTETKTCKCNCARLDAFIYK